MAATDTTKLIIELQTILRGLSETLRGLDQIKKKLDSVASVKINQQSAQATDRAAASAQRLANQQQKLSIQSQELANRQERARQVSDRLASSAQRLTIAQQRANNALGQADRHVQFFRSMETAAAAADKHIEFFRNHERFLRSSPGIADAHVKDFKRITAAAEDMDSHVQFFREHEHRLAQAPQLDAHVKAFRALEEQTRAASERLVGFGNSLRSIGQGLSTVGATLSVAVTAPLVALGAASVSAAVQMDSLRRGLTAIVGSSAEAGRQLTRLTEIAKLPGIGFQEAIQGSIRLQAVGFSAQEAERALRQFSNAVALTGGGRDELERVTVQLGQLAAKGKVLSQDLRPIIEAAPAVGRALLQAFGTVNASDIEALGLTTKEFFDALVGQLEQLPRAAAGAKNSFENFRDTLFRAGAAVGEALLPPLIRLVEVAGPIITRLADIFKSLPEPVQVIVVAVGGLVAALGPVLFIVGQLTTGVGRLLVGLGQLNLLGLLPTIKNLKLLATGALAAAEAEEVLASATAATLAAIGGIVAVVTAAIAAYATYNAFQKDGIALGKEQVDALDEQIKGLKEQASFLGSLQGGVERTADQQQRLLEIYNLLNTQAQVRITAIDDESKRLVVLRAELEKLIQLREQERVQQAANLAGQIANTLQQVAANEQEIDSITARIQSNARLIESLQSTGTITAENSRKLAEQGITFSDVNAAVGALQAESGQLVEQQKLLREATTKLNGEAREEVQEMHVLERQTGLTAEQLLKAAKSMGVFRGDIQQTLVLLRQYTADTEAATSATDAFSRALQQQTSDLLKAGDEADDAAKKRKGLISAAGALAREASDSFEGALKTFRAFVAAQPELRAALQREAQIEGKSFDEFVQKSLEKAFGRGGRDKSGTSLRNAQEELAKALAAVQLASSEEQVRIEKEKNDQFLAAQETAQKLQLISYREFLETRADLATASIREQIGLQNEVVKAAQQAQLRLVAAAQVPGIPVAERVRRQAQAAKANEEEIKARAKLNDLTAKREQIEVELGQTLRVLQFEQVKDIRQLDIQFAELQGHIEDALNAATVEKFREKLTDLALTQDRLNKQLKQAQREGNADRAAQLTQAIRINQSQIDAIQLIVQQERASNNLAAAQELVRRAKEKQADLESQLSFEVENRGLKEEEAIRRRLEGEQRLAASLQLARYVVRDTVAALQAQGVEPPRALVEFVRDINASLRGLGELSFREQFRLAQKEFDRFNDERLRKIADVERAVRERDIAEAEGLLLIRRINEQYSADLEQQVALLKQIATQSNDASLQRQAQSAEETVKDATAQLADFNRQLRSASIDALQEGFTNFFVSLTDRTKTAKDKLLDLVNSVSARIQQVIAENLSKKLIESIFGDGKATGGIIASVRRLLGLGGGGGIGSVGGLGGVAAAQSGAAAASTALVTGATTAATALVTGGTTAGTTLAATITAAATAFSAAVVAAGAAFAAAVAASSSAQAVSAIGSGIGNFALGGLLPAIPGGQVVRVAEAGFPEAVLTTDPRHAARQVAILRQFLQETRGLGGRIRSFAMGGFTDRIDISAPNVSLSNTGIGELAVAGAPSTMRLRQVLVDQRDWRNEINSPEGEQVLVDFLYKKQHVIRKLSGGGGGR